MSTTQKNNLFKSFSQGDPTITKKYGGTGLGLVISYRLGERTGGQFYVDSQQGEGSQFIFTFPIPNNSEMKNTPASQH